MTLTNGASSGNAGVNPGGAFGFDAANLSASANMQILLQTNNDLILSIYKTIVDSTQEINRKIVREALRDDIRDIKLNQQRNDRTLQEEATMWRTHTEQLLAGQGSRHLQDVSRLQDMVMKLVVSQPPQLSTSTGGFVTQEGFLLYTTSLYTIHSAPSFTTTKPTFVTYTPAITTTTPTVTSTMSSTTTNTTFGVTGTVPFGGSLFGGGNNAGTNTFANLAAKAAQSKPGQAGGGFLSGNNGGISSDGSKQSLFGASPFSVTFVARCKLYRYDRQLKENKERGLGDIKILFNPKTKKYRCVMRREKVFKICANFPVVHDLSLHKREQMPTVYTWACKDFSEDSVGGLDETFTARFKDASIAEEFHQKMTEAIDAMQ
uniref:RanBD1 domain-containing protein n=2 Tax=Meloidogyne javanica TaxID=6303 RepID=A0A915LLA1_MELJA